MSAWSVVTSGWHDVAHGADVVRHDVASVADHAVKLVKNFVGFTWTIAPIALLKESISAIRKNLVVLATKVNDARQKILEKTAAVVADG